MKLYLCNYLIDCVLEVCSNSNDSYDRGCAGRERERERAARIRIFFRTILQAGGNLSTTRPGGWEPLG